MKELSRVGHRYLPRALARLMVATLVLPLAVIAAPADDGAAHSHGCRLWLEMHFEPEVPDTRDPGFLSFLANRPGFVLTWIAESKENMTVTIELSGPGPDYLCSDELKIVSRDARVLRLRVVPNDSITLASQ